VGSRMLCSASDVLTISTPMKIAQQQFQRREMMGAPDSQTTMRYKHLNTSLEHLISSHSNMFQIHSGTSRTEVALSTTNIR
jgi:hypothetical protein